jgi:hypothetical protein
MFFLPVFYSDNFITLLPGKKIIVETGVKDAGTRGEKSDVVVEGLSIQ